MMPMKYMFYRSILGIPFSITSEKPYFTTEVVEYISKLLLLILGIYA